MRYAPIEYRLFNKMEFGVVLPYKTCSRVGKLITRRFYETMRFMEPKICIWNLKYAFK